MEGPYSEVAKDREEGNVADHNTEAADHNTKAADHKPKAADNRPEAADHKPKAADNRPEAADHKPKPADIRPEAADHKTKAADNRPEAADHKTKAADNRPEAADHKTKAADNRPEAADHKTKAADNRPEAADHKTKAADNRPEAADHKTKDADHDTPEDNDCLPADGCLTASRFPESVGEFRRRREKTRGQWLVFVSCCFAAFVSQGTTLGLGSVYLDILDTFSTSRPLAALVQSLSIGLSFGAGVFTGPILGRVGAPPTLMAGGLLCCVGCIGSSLAPNIYVLIVCFGVLTGTGVSCSFLASLIVTGISFHKKRHLAVPIVTMSGGAGIACFPSLVRWLVDEYALRGMFLILAGICLNVVLFGLVVRTFGASKDPGGKYRETELETEEAERTGNIRQTSDRGQTDGEMVNLKQRHAVVTISENVEVLSSGDTDLISRDVSEAQRLRLTGTEELPNSKVKLTSTKEMTSTKMFTSLKDLNSTSTKELTSTRELTSIKELTSTSTNMLTSTRESTSMTELTSTSTKESTSMTSTRKSRWSLSRIFQTGLLHNSSYVLVTLTCYSLFFGFALPLMFLTDITKARGLSVKQGTQLLTVLSTFSMVGKGAVALLHVIKKMAMLRLFAAMIFGSALAMFSFTLLDYLDGDVFAGYATVCAIFGLFFGSVITSGQMACLELVSLHQYAVAQGYQFFVGGFSTFIAGPIGGLIKELTGSYNPLLYFALAHGLLAVVTVVGVVCCTPKSRAA